VDTILRQNKLQAIAQDQARIRENMTALKGSAAERRLLGRYTRQLDEQESAIESLTRVADLESRHERAPGVCRPGGDILVRRDTLTTAFATCPAAPVSSAQSADPTSA
jgi:hypothetical protein